MAGRRILYIDRDDSVRAALASLLEGEGHDLRVTDAVGAREALAGGSPEVVIYSRALLEESEAFPVERLFEGAAGARLVALSDRGEAVARTGQDAVIVLPRPVNLEELRRILREE